MSVIALLTDFGLADHYVGTVKGVILSHAPGASIVDIAHDVPAHGIRTASYLLWASYRYFPANTVFVCVVDPGVGSTRRIVCVKVRSYCFLAPDNGVLDLVLSEEKVSEAIEVRWHGDEIVGLRGVRMAGSSSTFHGRDVFAPVAAALSKGIWWSREAKRIELSHPALQFVDSFASRSRAKVFHVDRFGNIVTNIRLSRPDIKGVRVGRRVVRTWISHYAEAPRNIPCLIIGSSGLVEVVAREQSAQRLLRASLDTPLEILVR